MKYLLMEKKLADMHHFLGGWGWYAPVLWGVYVVLAAPPGVTTRDALALLIGLGFGRVLQLLARITYLLEPSVRAEGRRRFP